MLYEKEKIEHKPLKINYSESLDRLPYEISVDQDILESFMRAEGFDDDDLSHLHIEVTNLPSLPHQSGQYHPLKNRLRLNVGSMKMRSADDTRKQIVNTLLHEIAHAKDHLSQGERKKLEPQTVLYHALGYSALLTAGVRLAMENTQGRGHVGSTVALVGGLGFTQLIYRLSPYEQRAREYADNMLNQRPELINMVSVEPSNS